MMQLIQNPRKWKLMWSDSRSRFTGDRVMRRRGMEGWIKNGMWKFMKLYGYVHYLECRFKTHQFVHVKYMQSTVYKWYVNKVKNVNKMYITHLQLIIIYLQIFSNHLFLIIYTTVNAPLTTSGLCATIIVHFIPRLL